MTEILSYQLDIRSLQDLSDHNRRLIDELMNENETYKRKIEQMDKDRKTQEHHRRAFSIAVKELRDEKTKLTKVSAHPNSTINIDKY